MTTLRETHVYRVLKASWGIWISITASARFEEAGTDGAGDTQEESPLQFDGMAAKLPESYRSELSRGWSQVLPVVRRALSGGLIEVTVEEVRFVDTDFQVDGLAVAMCRWTEAAFGLEARPIVVTFDRGANRYDFDWS